MLKALGALLALGGFTLTIFAERIGVSAWIGVICAFAGMAILITMRVRKQLSSKEDYSLNQ